MRHLIPDLSTESLLRVAAALETRLVEGTARDEDIDTYVRVHWEIAERLGVDETYRPEASDGRC